MMFDFGKSTIRTDQATVEDLLSFLDNYRTRYASPVGCYHGGASPYGVLDLCGNVWEYTRSLWGSSEEHPEFGYPYSSHDGRENIEPAVPHKSRRKTVAVLIAALPGRKPVAPTVFGLAIVPSPEDYKTMQFPTSQTMWMTGEQ